MTASAELGTLAWARQTGGVITSQHETALALEIPAVLALSSLEPTMMALSMEALAPPKSALTVEADELWADVAPAWLHGHGMRTWFYAAAMNEIFSLAADPELLYCAAILHDLGLTSAFAPDDVRPCFAVSGAHGAWPTVAAHRGELAADQVYEAIAMHLNLSFEGAPGLCQAVSAGTLVDVTGTRLQVLPGAFVAHVNERYPRGSFGVRVGEALHGVASMYRHTRCAWLDSTLGLSTLTTQHPLDEAHQAG